MRKMIAVLTSVLIIFALTACGRNELKQSMPEESKAPDSPTPPAQEESEENGSKGSRVLIAYFSMPEDVDISGVDAVASASIVVRDGEQQGNTEYAARILYCTF